MNSASVDLFSLAPPFNRTHTDSAPSGSAAAGAAFKDAETCDDAAHRSLALLNLRAPTTFARIDAARLARGKGMAASLGLRARRLVEMWPVLKPPGSLSLPCDPTASHDLKRFLDRLFGAARHRSEMVWCSTGPGSPDLRQFNRKPDVRFGYAAGWAPTAMRRKAHGDAREFRKERMPRHAAEFPGLGEA